MSHRGSASSAFPHPLVESRLENGLRVAVVPLESPGLAAHHVAVRVGSRNEVEEGLSGFAHFFEHMMFRGTPRFPPERYNDVLKGLGADANAFTDDDWTCYHVTASRDALGTVMEIESDRFVNLRYDVESFQKEAGAVLGEYNKNRSLPHPALHERLRETAFLRHTYRHTTMGFLRDIESMPGHYDFSLEFFRQWYRPDNAFVVVTGDVRPEDVIDLAGRHWGSWSGSAAGVEVPEEPPQTEERRARVAWPTPTLPLATLAWRVPAFRADDVDARALDILAAAAFSQTSPLYRELVLEKQWVEGLWAGQEDHRDPYLFEVLLRVKDRARLDDVVNRVQSELDRLATDTLPAERVEAVKSHLRYGFLSSLDTPDRVAHAVAHALQLTADASSIDARLATLGRVDAQQVRGAASRAFGLSARTWVTLTQEPGSAG